MANFNCRFNEEKSFDISFKNEDHSFFSGLDEKQISISGDYRDLANKPLINNVELDGNRTAKELKLQEEMTSLTNIEIEEMFKDFN